MKLKDLLPISSITLLILTIFACVVPGQAVSPISTLGPGGVETAIASTGPGCRATDRAGTPGDGYAHIESYRGDDVNT